jgi:hypothetical protein
VVPKTQSSYFTATAKYTTFCTDVPWIIDVACVPNPCLSPPGFSFSSLVYSQPRCKCIWLQLVWLGDFKWTLTGDEKVYTAHAALH